MDVFVPDNSSQLIEILKIDDADKEITEIFTTDCEFCGKELSIKNLNRHIRICKNNPESPIQNIFSCECGSTFNRKDNFSQHKKYCINDYSPKKKSCLYQNCSARFHKKVQLMKHLEFFHKVKLEPVIKLDFTSEKDFLAWKEKEETRTFSYFPKSSGKLIGQFSNRNYYYCQRDGSDRAHRKKGEAPKTNRKNKCGRIKQNILCIAKLVEVIYDNGYREITYNPNHNHPLSENDLSHQPVPTSVNEFINKQISLGVPAVEIYHAVQEFASRLKNGASSNVSKKSSVVSKKLIKQRIAKNMKKMRLHSDDITSVSLKVDLLHGEEYDPVIIFKPKGVDLSVEGSSCKYTLDKNLFMLGIQTEFQRKAMVKGCRKILIVNYTDSITEDENMKLLSFMISDDENKGCPVGHFITNLLTNTTIEIFMTAIKNRIESYQESLTINCVITNDNPVLVNGIERAMQTKIHHILCHWHLHNTFQENIKLEGVKNKLEVYNDLKAIISSETIKQFKTLVEAFKIKHNMDSKQFVNYLSTNFLDREEQWAMCYRKVLGHGNVNTIAHIESFHNKLKSLYFYSNTKHKRIDDLLNTLLSIKQDNLSLREINISCTIEGQIVYKRHRDSMVIRDDRIKEISDNLWSIEVRLKKGTRFYIERIIRFCNRNFCLDKCNCSPCQNLCSHLYTCSCPESNYAPCKHIHKLHSLIHEPDENPDEPEEINFYYIPPEVDDHGPEEIHYLNIPQADMPEQSVTNASDETKDIQYFTIPEASLPENTVIKRETSGTNTYEQLQEDLSKLKHIVQDKNLPQHLVSTVSTEISNILKKCFILTETCDKSEMPNIPNLNTS